MTGRRLGLSVLLADSGAQIVAVGELDVETAPALADAVADTARSARRIVLDLSAVTYLDPAAAACVRLTLAGFEGQVAVIPRR